MRTETRFKLAFAFAVILGAALTAAFTAPSAALAAAACPGGGTQKCTYHCTGLNPPVCSYGEPCTCSLGARRPVSVSAPRGGTGPTRPVSPISGGGFKRR